MRKALVIGFSALAFMSSLGPSEARFRLRLSGLSGKAHPAIVAPTLVGMPAPALRNRSGRMATAIAAPLGVEMAEASAPDEVGAIGPSQRTLPVAAPIVAKDPSAWCPTGRVSGSGAGFCIIN